MSIKVAVYGSLKAGFGNHGLLADSDMISTGTVEGWDLYDLGAFPCIVGNEGAEAPVAVEVYSVTEETFARLDMLEGYPSFYDRKQVVVYTEDGNIEDVWIYYHHKEPSYGSLVSNGIW